MSNLLAGGSTQSRARRPVPYSEPMVLARTPVGEVWWVGGSTHRINVTWTFDQGGPVLGYTCKSNKLTRGILKEVAKAEDAGLYGPGSVASELEYRAATRLATAFHAGGALVRFFANGSDACDAAIRTARAATGRTSYVSFGYHGSSLWFSRPPQNHGVPDPLTFGRVDVTDLGKVAEWVDGYTAAVIVEVPSTGNYEHVRACLLGIQNACVNHGAAFILDEVVTGFRLAFGGAASYYGVQPDLVCYGKAMSNGRGVSALVGVPYVMEPLVHRAFYSNTYNGDPLNLAHVVGTFDTLVDMDYEYLSDVGIDLIVRMPMPVHGHPARSYIDDNKPFKRLMVDNGVVMDQPNYVTFAHTAKHVKVTAEAAFRSLDVLQKAGM